MTTITITRYEQAQQALRNNNLAQSLYDEGAVIMKGTLLTLHGSEHRARRALEMGVFKRDFFRYYEREVFPRTLAETIAPFERTGRADLLDLGYRVTMNLTADFAGIDRPRRDGEETEWLRRMVATFSEGATLVHSTRDKDEVRREVIAALAEFDTAFYQPSLERRTRLIARFKAGAVGETDLPRDVLTTLLRNEERLELPEDLLRREIAFYLQAGSHSTANATVHAFHDITTWCAGHPEDAARIAADAAFLQRCVHESLRMHPSSPVAWRSPTCPVSLLGGTAAGAGDRVILEIALANRDREVFGEDADAFNPHRRLPEGVQPWGLTFGAGLHACIGRELDGGVAPRIDVNSADADPAELQMGIVPLFTMALFARKAQPDPARPATRATITERPNWGSYPILMEKLQ